MHTALHPAAVYFTDRQLLMSWVPYRSLLVSVFISLELILRFCRARGSPSSSLPVLSCWPCSFSRRDVLFAIAKICQVLHTATG